LSEEKRRISSASRQLYLKLPDIYKIGCILLLLLVIILVLLLLKLVVKPSRYHSFYSTSITVSTVYIVLFCPFVLLDTETLAHLQSFVD